MKNKFSKYCFDSVIVFMVLILFGGCNKEDNNDISMVEGKWYGIRSYYNPVGGTKYQYLTITFNANKTGELEYESPVSYAISYFTYSIKGNKIYCYGVKADTYEDNAYEYTLELEIVGDRLYPKTQYQYFILTKDGSVVTDGDGNEIKNNNDQGDNDNQSEANEKNRIRQLIGEHVNVSSSYKDYFWHFYVESDLNSFLSNKRLEYGVGHGDVGGGQVFINTSSNSYVHLSISQKKQGDKYLFDIDVPFWCYFWLGMDPSDDDTSNKCIIYYEMLEKLKVQSYDNLTTDEKGLYQNLITYLNKYEKQTKWSYHPSIWVKVDNDWFEVP